MSDVARMFFLKSHVRDSPADNADDAINDTVSGSDGEPENDSSNRVVHVMKCNIKSRNSVT